MAPCTNPGTSREVNMARGGLILAAGRVRSKKYEEKNRKKKRKICAPPKTDIEIHSRPATATNSRRCATKHVASGSPYSRASSLDPAFVEISLACTHTYPHRCCCAVCIRFGARCSCQRSFCFLYCDTRYMSLVSELSGGA